MLAGFALSASIRFEAVTDRSRPASEINLTKVCVNRLHLLVYAPVCPALQAKADVIGIPTQRDSTQDCLCGWIMVARPTLAGHLAPVTSALPSHTRQASDAH